MPMSMNPKVMRRQKRRAEVGLQCPFQHDACPQSMLWHAHSSEAPIALGSAVLTQPALYFAGPQHHN